MNAIGFGGQSLTGCLLICQLLSWTQQEKMEHLASKTRSLVSF